ncbi:MAG: B12-binding domain-containing radical SAM protein [Nitrososphaeria archaeon]|nr:B12-binding domain-containing radical SAM protein [Nitrososphaeria archaeon]
MRILFITPPTPSVVKEVLGSGGPPLGLAYLAATAREEGWEPGIIDALTEGLSLRELERRISGFDPDVVGITATTSMMPDVYEVAKIVKGVNEGALVLLGGPHATFMAHEILRECPHVDLVVRGEGEETLREILGKLEKGHSFRDVLGVTYREGGLIKDNPPRPLIRDLDALPHPEYDLLPMEKYVVNGVRFGAVMTSRGCPYNCVFCSSSLQFGKGWRSHSVDRVIDELKILSEEFGVKEVEFLDDTFTLNPKRVEEISKRVVEEKLDISWSASSRVNTFNYQIGCSMRRAGAHTVYFGIESGSDRTLKFIEKGISRMQSVEAVKAAKRAGLRVLGSFVMGFPYETEDEIRETISFANRVGVDLAQFTIATPYPGTRLWEIALEKNLLLTRNWRKFTTVDVVMKNIYLTPQMIKKLFLWAYLTFYLHPRRVIEDVIRNRGFILRRAIPAAFKFVKRSILSLWE